jgi:murein L,D-transpeptidase YcbB/YkuD
MRNIITTLFALGMLFTACELPKSSKKEATVEITPRNYSINKSNAYNDLFLDSMAVEKFITAQTLNDTVANAMRSFYNARNYQFTWFASNGLTEQALGFRSLYDYSKDTSESNKALENKLDAIMVEDSLNVSATDPSFVKAELQLTERFINYFIRTYQDDNIRTRQIEQFIPIQKKEVLQLADSVLANKNKDTKNYEAANDAYRLMKEKLQQYREIAGKGGWDTIPAVSKKLKLGDNAPAIPYIKKRMTITGELKTSDSSQLYNEPLENAIKTFQQHHGFTPDGIITPALITEMNVPALARVEQLLINMERMRWMPDQPEGKLILVNIPEFMLHVQEGKNQTFEMEVIVGKEGHNTTLFSGKLNQIVFSPNWNVPASIVRKEILPAMNRNKNYLQQHNMEIKGERNGLPVIRQLPGKKNSLGKVKFLFPNSYNIYFHDTPAKSLFNHDNRAYSHGCIRLADPVKMATWLLENSPEWTPEKIDEAMNQTKEKYVKVKDPVPVMITYYTAWVDHDGALQFRKDIYGHDSRLAAKMFF